MEETANSTIPEKYYVYLHIAKGHIQVNEQFLNIGDAARILDCGNIHFCSVDYAEVLIFEMQIH
ncbi:pirin [Acinetobacter sp. TY2]|uniref:pirin family protein n=1 Tax=unclassified Acinetobacter TaxID=196816 RepID=UPI0039177182